MSETAIMQCGACGNTFREGYFHACAASPTALRVELNRLACELREAKDVIDSAYQSLNWSGARYMDPPDGGNPTLGEMLGRMAEDAQCTVAAEAEVARLREVIRGAATAGVQVDEPRLTWVELQMERDDWQALVAAAQGGA